jgi:catechol 2,3-dioxygenase-like lactoylglutathione lyase family enzyme
MMITGIHHAQITIPRNEEEKAKDFYCGILGLKKIDKPESLKKRGGFWLQAGNLEVHAGTEDGFDRFQTKAHLAYEVTDLNLWRNKLADQGIIILESVPIPGMERFEFRDPFGNRVEMLQRVNKEDSKNESLV